MDRREPKGFFLPNGKPAMDGNLKSSSPSSRPKPPTSFKPTGNDKSAPVKSEKKE